MSARCPKCGWYLTMDSKGGFECHICVNASLRAEVERLNKLVVGLDWRSGQIKELHSRLALAEKAAKVDQIDIVFDGPPSHESGRFVEVENSEGESVNFGEWVHRDDGYWVLRFRAALAPRPGGEVQEER